MRTMLMLMLGWLHFLAVATQQGTKKKKSSGGGSSTLELDFTGTNRRDSRLPEGEYVFKIESAQQTKAKSTGNAMIVFTLRVAKGQFKGEQVTYRQMLLKQNLWSFRNLLEAMGHNVPEGKIKIRLDSLMNKQVGARVADGEPYNNRIKSEIVDFLKPDAVQVDAHLKKEAETPDEEDGGDLDIFNEDTEAEWEDDEEDEGDDEEEEDEDTEEEEDEGEDEEEEEEDEDEEEFDPDEQEDTPEPDPSSATREQMSEYLGTLDRNDVLEWAKSYSVPRVKNKKKPTYIKEILDAMYEGDENAEDDEEEEEEEKPKPKKKAAVSSKKSSSSSKGSKKAQSNKKAKDKPAEDELDDLDLDDIE